MGLNKKKILNISVTINSRQEILEYIEKSLVQSRLELKKNGKYGQKYLCIVTPNPEQIVLAQKNNAFRRILNNADIALPDGSKLIWALRMLQKTEDKRHNAGKTEIYETIPGVEFMESLIEMASEKGFGVALIGGREKIALKAFECLKRKFPRLSGWAQDGPSCLPVSVRRRGFSAVYYQHYSNKTMKQCRYGSLEEYMQRSVEEIRTSGVRIVFVGLGAPKQEFFIEELISRLRDLPSQHFCIFMSVGGSFDIISGRIPRASVFWRNCGLEWFWRLLKEPWRFQRQLSLITFLLLVFVEKLKRKPE